MNVLLSIRSLLIFCVDRNVRVAPGVLQKLLVFSVGMISLPIIIYFLTAEVCECKDRNDDITCVILFIYVCVFECAFEFE